MDETLVHALRDWLAGRMRGPVEVRATHISWVLLRGRIALKLKKPVRLPFLDFSTLQAREHYCREELRLNRRLAPSVYRRVMAVRGSIQAPHLGGDGPIIDHVLCMRRFPDEAVFDRRLAAGLLEECDIDALAARLGAFHRAAPGAAGRLGPESIAPVRRTFDALGATGDHELAALRDAERVRARELAPAIESRRAGGWFRAGHGDLHLANLVVLGHSATAFDCIEFDPELQCIDVINDIAFVTMDLAAHGRADLAARFLDGWLQCTGDHEGIALLPFYETYRAAVRALVGALPGATRGGPDYRAIALALSARVPQPRLAVACGLSGSGKSTLALRLVEATGAVRVRSDVERKRMAGLDMLARPGAQGTALYGPEMTRRTYDRLVHLARVLLEGGRPVIVDAACLRRDERDRLRALARELRVPCLFIECMADDATLRQRVAQRQARGDDPSDADLRVLDLQLAWRQPIGDDERAGTLGVDTTAPIDAAALARAWMHAGVP